MDLSLVKREVLEALLLHSKPVKAVQVAKEIAKDSKVVQMHLIGLTRVGYANSPEKGAYTITENGKEALGIPAISREKALSILAKNPREKAFHFYAGIGKPLNIYAHDFLEFCDRIDEAGAQSAEFHASRGDFETWFADLGDVELSKKTASLKKKLTGEALQARLRELVANRCTELSEKAAKAGKVE